ncbi:MAG: colanic acid biosynthesis glycosyltransferase WcaL [Calditrichaeota bacterium]|nr:MAG: colanic acid biosynthesis glycosyltransferase WcaL [Calditrichota bacterium]
MQKKIKVAYILHRFPYITETFIMREMYWLRKCNVDVTIFSLLSPVHKIVQEQAKELLPVTYYSAFISPKVIKAQFYFLLRSPVRYFKAFFNMIRQTFREIPVLLRVLLLFPESVYFAQQMEIMGIEHIHAHFVWLEGIAAGIVKDLVGISFTIHPHAFGLFMRNQKNVRTELQNASGVVTVSTHHTEYIANLCPKISQNEIDIVHYGLEVDRYIPGPKQEQNGKAIRIVAVGDLREKKGPEYLIDACALLAKRGYEFHCDFIGHGNLENKLRAQIDHLELHENITLCGVQPLSKVLQKLQESDIFALPCVVARDGDRDGMPNVLIEAMACELPVVTTPVAGIPDLVIHGETGMLAKERDAETLAEALEILIEDKALRERLGKQAREKVLDEFQIQKSAEKLAGIFKKFIDE